LTRKAAPKPPSDLSAVARRWWRSIAEAWQLEAHHYALLDDAARMLDRAREAREAVARDGAYYLDRFGQPHAHPGVRVEAESNRRFQSLVRELALDDDRPPAAPRLPSRFQVH
jgi:phage terminase small subunit